MSDVWFTKTERREMATPIVRRITKAIRNGSIDEALELCDELAVERIVLHDLLADITTALVTWIGRKLGETALKDAYTTIFEQSAKRSIYDVLSNRLNRRIEAALLARSCWIAHSCSGAGQQPASFRLEEDGEKFTFVLDPCGSGGRLWRMGRYGPDGDFGLTSKAYCWSFNRKNFPYYCVHCAFLNEILPSRQLGYPLWPVDPPAGPEDECRWHLYKNRKTFDRGRAFSAEQLEDMSTFTPDKIRRHLAKGDHQRALRVCRRMGGEFLFLHNLYVSGLASGLDFVAKRVGEEALGDVFRYLFNQSVETQIRPLIEKLSRKDATSWLIFNIFLASTCGGTGYPPAKVVVTENASAVTITLAPCASGGKLIRNGAYERCCIEANPQPCEPGRPQRAAPTAGLCVGAALRGHPGSHHLRLLRHPQKPSAPTIATSSYGPSRRLRVARETLENYLIDTSARLPIPGFILEPAVFRVVDYLSETRKPAALARTSKAFPWSGGIKGLPYYCALCTALLHESDCDWISVQPPASAKHRCTWRFRK